MKLVSSNKPSVVKDTIQRALKTYRETADVPSALGVLTELKGIGPATASLLLSVHDADNVMFFSDEAFYWLCCGGLKGPIKYNLKEYLALNKQAQTLCSRLGVKAVDVERVAFVLLRQQSDSKDEAIKPALASEDTNERKPGPAKRKALGDNDSAKTPVRRSKRRKQS